MKRLVMAMAFACAVSVSAVAGDIPTVPGPTPGSEAPPPQSLNSAPSQDSPFGIYEPPISTDVTLTVVQAVFSLLSV